MKIDVVPQRDPDLTLWGKPRFFDFKTYPGAVVLAFENDVVMTIPMTVFERLRFSIPDQQFKVAKPEEGAPAARVTVDKVARHMQHVKLGGMAR